MEIHPERITQNNRKIANGLDNNEVGFPVWEKDFSKIETKTALVLTCFVMKTNW